jgi:predicted MFS family arabinose efflux permease
MQRSFWITALISFINSLSFTILIPTIYLYAKQFDLSDQQASLLFASYSIAQFFATSIIGKLSDRFGRKPLLIISLAGTVVANLIAGNATTAAMLFGARLLDGVTGGNASVAQAIISDVTPPDQRAKGYGIIGAAFGLGFVIGPVISLVAQERSLGTSFLVSSVVAAIGLLITIFLLPETLHPEDRKSERSIFDLGLRELARGFTMPRIGILLLINFLISMTFNIFTFAFQPYYINVLQQDKRSLALLFFFFGVIGVASQIQGVKFLTKKFGIDKILFVGILARGVAFILMPMFPNLSYFWIVSLTFAMFNSLVQPMVSTLISFNSKPEEQGIAAGLNASYFSISNGIGPVIAGALIVESNPSSYGIPLYLAGVLNLLIFGFALKTRSQYSVKPIGE